LDSNRLSGNLPASLSVLRKLTWFSVAHNRLNGTISSSISQLDDLSRLYVCAVARAAGNSCQQCGLVLGYRSYPV
jgi:hypothetical protein